jgi:MtfA peptidase
MIFGWLRRRRRAALRARPTPSEWLPWIEARVPYARRLPPADRAELLSHVQVFLAEKRLEGCGGLELTDEMRVTIAAQACVLLLHRDDADYFPEVSTILVHPTAYRARTTEVRPDGTVIEGHAVRLGEAWHRGELVLSWDDVVSGAANPQDGRNVVLHEFAHKLDDEDGRTDGAPPLATRAQYGPWARVLSAEFLALKDAAARGRRSVLDRYGATNPAEFFAVATEAFFEKPAAMKRKAPELYDQLSLYYRQDPAGLTGAGRSPSP